MTSKFNGVLLKKGETAWTKKKVQILATDGAVSVRISNANDKCRIIVLVIKLYKQSAILH